MDWSGDGLICTCFKVAADGKGLVMRWFNAKTEPAKLSIHTDRKIVKSNILEECVAVCNGEISVGAKEIVTVRIED
jgi:alpha-mannosidase